MAKEKVSKLSGDREMGPVTKRLSSGMYENSKGEKIPPLPGIVIGSKIRLVDYGFVIVDGKKKEVFSAADADAREKAELKARIEALEKQLGEKGSATKTAPAQAQGSASGVTPQKVSE